MTIGVMWQFNHNMREQLHELSAINTDSIHWYLAQSEVELLTLQKATLLLLTEDGYPVQEVREKFDIFYSRINTLQYGKSFQEVRQQSTVDAAIKNVKDKLQQSTAIIDASDEYLLENLQTLQRNFQDIYPDLRTISLEGVQYFSRKTDIRHATIVQTLQKLFTIIVILFLILAGTVLILSLMFKAARQQNNLITSARNRLQSLFATSFDAIVVTDQQGIIQNFNRSAERIYGFTAHEAIGHNVRDILLPPDRIETADIFYANMRRNTQLRTVENFGMRQSFAKHKSGLMVPVEISISINRETDGPLLVAYIRDVTRRQKTEADLIEARDRAVEGERQKTRMITVMNHEMRTPLNGILGTLDLLKTTGFDDHQRKLLNAMDHSSRLLLHHVNDVLEATHAYSSQINLSLAPFDPEKELSELLDGMRAAAEKRNNSLTLECFCADNRLLNGDIVKIRQIIVNLVGNAIKFTENGQISVQLDRIRSDGTIEIQVSDTGVGIADEDIDKIFDEFVTLGSFYDRKAEGTGLGLAIVKRLVKAMDGAIDVVSEPGEGTAFTLHLKLDIATMADVTEAPELLPYQSHAGRQILLVEDNEINRLVLKEMLKLFGCVITEAVDGIEGIKEAERKSYDLILMDISMPRMNGIDATAHIRGGRCNVTTPIVALTAHAMPEDIKRFRVSGMQDVLIKPLNRTGLRQILDRNLMPLPKNDFSANSTSQELIGVLGPVAATKLKEKANVEISEGLTRLTNFHTDETASQLARLAHKLAGSSAIVGYHDMQIQFSILEKGFKVANDKAKLHAMQKAADILRDDFFSNKVDKRSENGTDHLKD
ncbi:ATP-binding protein [Paracoccus sp. JM45]|uniref:ATP-binding protein n=1 Tax=Paracoccus sp. JM45 TaxID=2283626 RepID=UPI0011C41A53|nr:ATP-binding protein [Paracoccus sp. JM45]